MDNTNALIACSRGWYIDKSRTDAWIWGRSENACTFIGASDTQVRLNNITICMMEVLQRLKV